MGMIVLVCAEGVAQGVVWIGFWSGTGNFLVMVVGVLWIGELRYGGIFLVMLLGAVVFGKFLYCLVV